MDFIERWFGIEPDGGTGSLEALWPVVLVAFVAIGVAAVRRRRARRGRRARPT